MKAVLRSARIAPKKANILARMVRGMKVSDAQEALKHTNKKAARMIEKLLASAVANASHNDKKDTAELIITSIVVNQGTAYRRGMPKARGQQRPFRKFLSHISLELGYPSDGKIQRTQKNQKIQRKTAEGDSQTAKTPVEMKGNSGGKKTVRTTKQSSASSESSESSASS